MKQEGYPWMLVGPGPEPRFSADFASRVIEQARTTRARQRRLKIGAGAAAGVRRAVRDASLDAPDTGESAYAD